MRVVPQNILLHILGKNRSNILCLHLYKINKNPSVTLQTSEGTVTVVVSSDTYVISEVRLRRGMTVAAFYDAQVPVPLIYPPQYRAVILGRKQPNETITVDYFDETLTNNDNTLKLNVSPATDIVGSNGQPFRCSLADRLLIVYYTNATKSIPAQIVPRKIIVMC